MNRANIIVMLWMGLWQLSITVISQEAIQWKGYARTSIMTAGPGYDLTNAFAEFSLQSSIHMNNAFLMTDLRWRPGVFFDQQEMEFDIKELYVGIKKPQFEISTGYQMVTWGRTDGFNPTDNINPRDYFFLTLHSEDQQQSNLMLKGKLRPTQSIEIEVIGLPLYRPSVYRYDLFSLEHPVEFRQGILPAVNWQNMGLAARINGEFRGFGASLSYFRGFDPFHGFRLQSIDWSTGSPVVTNEDAYHKKSSFGADLEIPAGTIIFRAETAWNHMHNSGADDFRPYNDLGYVVALELNIAGNTLLTQYIGKWVPDFTPLLMPVLTDPSNPLALIEYANGLILYEQRLFNRKLYYQQKQNNHALSITLMRSLARELLTTEVSGYYNITSNDWMVRPKLTWKFSDSFTIAGGAVYMYGPEKSLFDYSSAVLNGLILECKFNF